MSDDRRTLFGEVNYEIDRAQVKHGQENDDTKNTPDDWTKHINKYAGSWRTMLTLFTKYDEEAVTLFRAAMIKVAALAIASVESLDRQTEKNGKPFYQAD